MKNVLFHFCLICCFCTASAQGIITTVAGGGTGGAGQPAVNAALFGPNDVLVDDTGNIYIAEEHFLWKVDTGGILRWLAGNGNCQVGGDGIPLSQAKFCGARAIAFDKAGDLYIADYGNYTVRRVDKTTGIITKYAGSFSYGYSGDGGLAVNAKLMYPTDIAFDANDNLYIADERYVIRRVDRQTGIITTIAGDGTQGTWNDGDTASKARIGAGRGICIDNVGNIYFTDPNSRKIGKINTQGILSRYCGIGIAGQPVGDGGPAINASTYASTKLRLDKSNNMFIADGYIRMITSSNGIIDRVAGIFNTGFSGDGGSALLAQFNSPVSTCLDKYNNLYIVDQLNYRIRKVTGFVASIDTLEQQQFAIFPNPSKGLFYINSSEWITAVHVRNMSGITVSRKEVNGQETQIDVRDQPSGVYLITILGKRGIATKKVIVHH